MRKLRFLNIALVTAGALMAAAWAAPAAANGERPAGPAVTGKASQVVVPKKVRRAAMRKRIAVTRLPVIPASRWLDPSYERIVAPLRLLIVGIQY